MVRKLKNNFRAIWATRIVVTVIANMFPAYGIIPLPLPTIQSQVLSTPKDRTIDARTLSPATRREEKTGQKEPPWVEFKENGHDLMFTQVVYFADSPADGHHIGFLSEDKSGCVTAIMHDGEHHADMCHEFKWREYCSATEDITANKTVIQLCSGWIPKGSLFTPRQFFIEHQLPPAL